MKIEQNKPHSIHLRLNDEQYLFISGLANAMGVGISDSIRILLNSTMIASRKVEEKTASAFAEIEKIKNAELGDLYANDKDNL